MNPLFIDWQPQETLFSVGSFSIRWYGLCWIAGLVLAYFLVKYIYARQGIDPAVDHRGRKVETGKFDPLLIYCFIGILVGARLGHCIFYEPGYFLTSAQGIVEMLLPIRFEPGTWDWHFTGYAGLASHGGTIGLFIGLLLYMRRYQMPLLQVLDIIALAAPVTACFIRLGNLMNSEIIGHATDVPWAFVFHTPSALVDGRLAPRHPTQLYEAIAYLVIFLIGWRIYKRRAPEKSGVGTGFYFGLCLAAIFAFRFFVEFLKEVQGGTDDGSTLLNVGQMLSIPFVVAGLWCMAGMPGLKKRNAQDHEKTDRT